MKIDAKKLIEALDAIEQAKGISREAILDFIKDSLTRVYKKQLGVGALLPDGTKQEDPIVRVDIDLDKGSIDVYNVRHVVKDVNDPALEVSLEDIKEIEEEKAKKAGVKVDNTKYNYGDEYIEVANFENLQKATLMSIKSIIRQRFNEADRNLLHEQFKDKLDSIITGKVEAIDDRGASINIGRTNVYLTRKNMIGDENFAIGDNIKVYICEESSKGKIGQIEVSRSNEGFLRSLFKEEIQEIYSDVIKIKKIARRASERSKVAVYCDDPNADPAAIVIGTNGSKIQKIVSQLGATASSKEKVDVIVWHDNPGLLLIEALKPAEIIGLYLDIDEDNKGSNYATVIVKDSDLGKLIGPKGVNIDLASRISGFKIDPVGESEALSKGLRFTPIEEFVALAKAEEEARKVEFKEKIATTPVIDTLPGATTYVAPQNRKYENEENDFDKALKETVEAEELENDTSVVNTDNVDVNTPKEETVVTNVKVKTTLDDLEALIDSDKNKKPETKAKFKKRKEEEKKDETSDSVVTNEPKVKMAIFSEEELKAIEEEEANAVEEENFDDEEDYSEYDDDSYYDK